MKTGIRSASFSTKTEYFIQICPDHSILALMLSILYLNVKISNLAFRMTNMTGDVCIKVVLTLLRITA